MQIRYAMSSPPASVPPRATLEEAARHMARARVGALPVVERDRVVGVLTDRDLVVRAMACGLSATEHVETVMSGDPVTVESDAPVSSAVHAMRSIDARHLPVTEEGRLVGVVSFDDLFCYMAGVAASDGALAEGVGVGLDDVDLPGLAAGAVDPDLVLQGVAAGGVVLLEGGQARFLETAGRGGDLVGGVDLDAEVVHAGVLAGLALDEDELERRGGDGEVGVAGAALGRFGAEELGVEGDGAFEVGYAQGQLDAGHDEPLPLIR